VGYRSSRDNETDRRLRPLIGLVAVLAGALSVAALLRVTATATTRQVATAATIAFLIAVSVVAKAPVRIRSATHAITWTDVGIVVGLAVAPADWVVLATCAGLTAVLTALRITPIKAVFSVGKNVLVAAGAGASLWLLDWPPSTDGLRHGIGPLALAYLVATVVDELLAIPVIALATRNRILLQFRCNWDLRLAGIAVRFVALICTLLILQLDPRLLPAVPLLLLSLHLTYSARVRARTEQQAWQRLAQIADALNVVDLDVVLTTAVTRAADLFSADEVEVELREPARLVRGGSNTVSYDGPIVGAPSTDGSVITAPLTSHDRTVNVGSLRLRFRGRVRLTERERYTLSAFASALCTAIRNASAYAKLARAAEQHEYAATHDALTGLANRRHLLERGNELLNREHSPRGLVGLLLLDLNHFKEINDTLGHRTGDRVLMQVAERIGRAVGDRDLVARVGGDEFAILFCGLPAPALAAHRAERVLAALHQPLDLDGLQIKVEASGGVAVASGGCGMDELLRRADVAMYQAKRAGQRLVTYTRWHTADPARRGLDGNLRRTVGDYEFAMVFQPIVDLGTGKVTAVEALTRWQHRERGPIGPLRYFEAAEGSDLLPAFVEAVLDQALIAANGWREAGFDLPVTINVTPRNLVDARFPSSVRARLDAHRLPADRLFLELSDALSISQLEVVDQVLGQLRDQGVRLILDGFGTWSSRISVLSRLPVQQLKIDQAFVTALETSLEAATVVRSTVELGRSLGLTVLAEGVESEPQRRRLWEFGCTAGQGNLFGRPMPASRLLAALRRGCGGHSGTLAAPLHEEAAIIRLPHARRATARSRERLA
jgi:diguanylate cyclase